ncbi:MAG: hypothetical protein AAFX93_19845, partial [Verrucomicrobiota bacterium]
EISDSQFSRLGAIDDILIMDATYIGNGLVALSTKGRGLLIANKHGKVEFDWSNLVPSATIFSCRFDGRYLWASYPGGLARIDLEVHRFDRSEGIIMLH